MTWIVADPRVLVADSELLTRSMFASKFWIEFSWYLSWFTLLISLILYIGNQERIATIQP